MEYPHLTGLVNPVTLRDAALDYVRGTQTAANTSLWAYLGNPTELFLPVHHPRVLQDLICSPDKHELFLYRMLLAMDTLYQTCHYFYGQREGKTKFEYLRNELQQNQDCMIYFKLLAWLSVGEGWRLEQVFPKATGSLNTLRYGLVTEYAEPILHMASCYFCHQPQLYEDRYSPLQLQNMREQAKALALEAQSKSQDFFQEEEIFVELTPIQVESIEDPFLIQKAIGSETVGLTKTEGLPQLMVELQKLLALIQHILKHWQSPQS